jgi:hypothetical protein
MSKNINRWLEDFKEHWIKKDIDFIITLFSKDVVYFETPFRKVPFKTLKKEWLSILDQDNISLEFETYNKENNKYTVKWALSYSKTKGTNFSFKGVYLMSLNDNGLCNEFIQYGEKED